MSTFRPVLCAINHKFKNRQGVMVYRNMPETKAVREYLAEHPRMIGGLFTMLLLLSQAGSVAAGEGCVCGP